jgi:hypothetical protein
MTWARWSVPCLLALAACGTKESGSSDPQLRSDMPARSASFYVEHRDELTEMETVCGAWRASQRPAASWPSVVFGNCNSVNTAKTMISNDAETQKLRKEAGI